MDGKYKYRIDMLGEWAERMKELKVDENLDL